MVEIFAERALKHIFIARPALTKCAYFDFLSCDADSKCFFMFAFILIPGDEGVYFYEEFS